MKQFNKNSLPESIDYNGITYKVNIAISSAMTLNNTPVRTIASTLKAEGRKAILVNVTNKALRGKTDLHGNPYQPTKWIFTAQ